MSSTTHYKLSRLMPVLALIVAILLILASWWLMSTWMNHDESTRPVQEKPTPSTGTVLPSAVPVPPDEERSVSVILKNGVKQYFKRDPELMKGSSYDALRRYESRLEPFVTESFVDDYITSPLSSPVDKAFRDQSGVQRVVSVEIVGGEEPEAGLEVQVELEIYSPTNKPRSTKVNLVVALVEQHDSWKINSLVQY